MLCLLNGHKLDAWSRTDSVTACTESPIVAALLSAKKATSVMQQHDHFGIALIDAEHLSLCYLSTSTKAKFPFENKRSPQQLRFTTIACQQQSKSTTKAQGLLLSQGLPE